MKASNNVYGIGHKVAQTTVTFQEAATYIVRCTTQHLNRLFQFYAIKCNEYKEKKSVRIAHLNLTQKPKATN